MRYRLVAAGAVLALLTALCGYLGLRSTAGDGDDDPACPSESLCIYGDGGSSGPALFAGPVPTQERWTGSDLGPARSVRNNSRLWACFYEKEAFGGAVKSYAPGARAAWDALGRPAGHGVGSIRTAKSRAGCLSAYERCPDRSLCLFQEASGRGAMTSWTGDTPGYGTDWPGRAGSVWNRTDATACLYRSRSYTGRWTVAQNQFGAFVVPPGSSVTLTAPYADALGSHRFATDPNTC